MSSSGVLAKGDKGDKGDVGPFGPMISLAAGTDLNTITTPGIYRVVSSNATAALNFPKDNVGGVIYVEYSTSTIVHQTFYPLNNLGHRWTGTRSLVNSWDSWRLSPVQRVDTTAGRAIYTWDDVNNRDQLTYGDTGWRDLTLDNGYTGSIQFRRVHYTVTIRSANLGRPPGGSLNGTFLNAVPTGFSPATTAWVHYPLRHNGGPEWFTFYRKQNVLDILDSVTNSDTNICRFEFTWSTNDPWPTSLPGTAVGGIPNL